MEPVTIPAGLSLLDTAISVHSPSAEPGKRDVVELSGYEIGVVLVRQKGLLRV